MPPLETSVSQRRNHGSLSTYITREAGAAAWATWWVLFADGSPVPMSRNCRIPACVTRNSTARARNARPRPDREPYIRVHGGNLLSHSPVGREVVLAAQQVFAYSPGIHTRSVRHRRPTQAVRCPWEGDEALKARRISSDWR
jgi:hypothetical protein